MRRRRFTDAQIEKWGDNGGGVHNIACVDERFRGGVGKLSKAGDGLLGSDKGADGVDGETLVEIGKLERERIIGRVRGHCSGFTNSTREIKAVQGRDTHHYKRQHLEYLGLP